MSFTVMSVVSPSYVIANCPGSPQMPGVMPGSECEKVRWNAVGTGPYEFVEFVPKDHLTLQSFDGYWGGPNNLGPPAIKRYEIRYVPEVATRELDLFTGATDAIVIGAPNIFDIIDKNSWIDNQTIKPIKPGIRVWSAPSIQDVWIMLNPRAPPLDNIVFRKAIAYSFPYDTYIQQATNGFATRLSAPVPPGVPGYDSSLDNFYNYDPGKAKQLFQQADWNGTIQLTIRNGDTRLSIAALLLKDSVAQIYPQVNFQINEVDTATWGTLFRTFKTPTYIGSWTFDIDDASDFVPNLVTPGGQPARFTNNFSNQTLINLADQASASLDPAQRSELYSQLQYAIMDSALDIFLIRPTALFAERDWVLPGDNSTGRAVNNPMWGDGDGGVLGGYHPYYLTKAPTTPQVNVMIGPPLLSTSFTPMTNVIISIKNPMNV